jgi:hypothetical protein
MSKKGGAGVVSPSLSQWQSLKRWHERWEKEYTQMPVHPQSYPLPPFPGIPGTQVLPILCPSVAALPLWELIRKAHCSVRLPHSRYRQLLAKPQEKHCDLVNGRKPGSGGRADTWVLWARSPLLPPDLLVTPEILLDPLDLSGSVSN